MDNFFVVFGGRDQWQTSTAKEFWNCCDTATMEAKWLPKKVTKKSVKLLGRWGKKQTFSSLTNKKEPPLLKFWFSEDWLKVFSQFFEDIGQLPPWLFQIVGLKGGGVASKFESGSFDVLVKV